MLTAREWIIETGSKSLGLAELQGIFVSVRNELVRYLTRRTGNPETAADLSHDIFEKLGAVRAHIPTPQKARSYLFRMAGNLAIDHRRVEARRTEILSGSQVLFEDVAFSPETVVVSRDELRQLEAALDELPPKCRQVFLLSLLHGFSHKEIARELEISVSLVEKYQLRALRHCRDRIGAKA